MILFFINRFNDIDHMTPIIYRLAKDGTKDLAVLSLNPFYKIHADFRLSLLKNSYQIPIEYQYNFYSPSLLHKVFGSIINYSYEGGSLRKNIAFIKQYLKNPIKNITNIITSLRDLSCGVVKSSISKFRMTDKIIDYLYNYKWSEKMLKANNVSVLIFDHAAQLKLYNVKPLLHAARNLSIPTVDVPHGIPLYSKHPPLYEKAFSDLITNNKDHIVMHHRWWRDECVSHGVDNNKLKILGSARFCSEWMTKLHEILPPDDFLKKRGNDKLKVVYMEAPADRYAKETSTVQEAIEKISELEFVHLVVKPQPRTNLLHFSIPKNADIAFETNSVNLIQWADVVISLISSIMIEVLIQNKVYIYPKYWHEERMLYDDFGACWRVENHDDLIEAFKSLKNVPTYKPYTQKNIDSFITEIVYNGSNERDVLGDYKEYILNISNNALKSTIKKVEYNS